MRHTTGIWWFATSCFDRVSVNSRLIPAPTSGSADTIFNIIVVYVDDILVCSTYVAWVAQFKRDLAAEFDIKDLGACTWILGMKVERDRTAGTITIHQGKYISDTLSCFGMTDCNGADIRALPTTPATHLPWRSHTSS